MIGELHPKQSFKNLFKNNKILKLHSIYILEICTFPKFKQKLNNGLNYHEYNTRFKNNFRQNQHNLKMNEKLSTEIRLKLLNKLQKKLRTLRNIFKIHLLKQKYYKMEDILKINYEYYWFKPKYYRFNKYCCTHSYISYTKYIYLDIQSKFDSNLCWKFKRTRRKLRPNTQKKMFETLPSSPEFRKRARGRPSTCQGHSDNTHLQISWHAIDNCHYFPVTPT